MTQRQAIKNSFVSLWGGGGGERRGKTGRGGEFGSLSFFPYLLFAPATEPKFFFCFMRAAVKTSYTHLTFAVADSTRQSLLLHKADFRCATTSTFKNCA